MRHGYDADAIRAAEQPLLDALPEGTLMQRAATALARRCAELLTPVYGSRVLVLAGSGGNGGDALYAGARLAARGARVDALLVSDKVLEPALDALQRAGGRVSRLSGEADDPALFGSADLVIDGMLGIGVTGELREPQARLAAEVARSDAVVVAVDVPSGVNASTGEVEGDAIRADVTVTFGALKAGLLVAPGAHLAGQVELVDIGLQPESRPAVSALDADDVARLLPEVGDETDKYRRGVVGIVAGSDTYTGAAQLAVGGALAVGVGMVRFASVAHPCEIVRQHWPEAVVTEVAPGDGEAVLDAGRVQAWVIGSGLGTDDDAGRIVEAVLGADVPVLVDADAITWLADHKDVLTRRTVPTLLTPHAGEFARLMNIDRGDVEANRLTHARRAAEKLGVTILLKSSTTVIADRSGEARVNTATTPYLGTAGSGDTLSGICGSLLAGGCSALDAGAAGSFIHGLAGRLASGSPPAPIRASDIAAHVPAALRIVRG